MAKESLLLPPKTSRIPGWLCFPYFAEVVLFFAA
jgi:hypothetical protein